MLLQQQQQRTASVASRCILLRESLMIVTSVLRCTHDMEH